MLFTYSLYQMKLKSEYDNHFFFFLAGTICDQGLFISRFKTIFNCTRSLKSSLPESALDEIFHLFVAYVIDKICY
jgi:hypothetical protein